MGFPIFQMLDDAIANLLEVSTEEYIEVINKLSPWRMEMVIGAFLEEDDDHPKKLKAIRIFKKLADLNRLSKLN